MINVDNISKQFGSHRVLKNISFSIDKGEIVGFLGCNGAGKTTMMRILTSYLSANSGKVSVAGYDVQREHLQVRRSIGYLSENPPLYYSMRVADYLKFAARLKDIEAKQITYQVDKAMSHCLLGEVRDKTIGTLSKGFKQRVGLAQAILNDPKVLILDEPMSGLDPLQVRQVRSLLDELKQERTVILSTHVLSETQQIAQRVLILKEGIIALDKKVDELVKEEGSLENAFIKVHEK